MTHDQIKALDKLIAAVEADSDIGFRFWFEADDAIPDLDTRMLCETAFSGSLDAAKALHGALLPEWEWEIRTINSPEKTSYVVLKGRRFRDLMTSENQNPARAWLIAILKAYRAQMKAS